MISAMVSYTRGHELPLPGPDQRDAAGQDHRQAVGEHMHRGAQAALGLGASRSVR
jgi:hypothetical protein